VKAKNQRLVLVTLACAAVVGAGLLFVLGTQESAAFFYAPADVAKNGAPSGEAARLGGMVAAGSLKSESDGVTIRFVVKDETHQVPVVFKGIAPDLFKENSGVVAEGYFEKDGSFTATNLLAKHDERYMPPELAGKMHKTETLSP
jgi:cytochrome c-type biogenesis protein CcmE